ncbi:MAG: ribonuclease III [Paracoccaceae bacterium]|nr:MAG: ribonuclease III [Paracoccaceae bacterium]
MKIAREISDFEDRIGHRFARPELLIRALTHASIAAPSRPSNERLEFLGDRVLGLAMAEALFTADTGAAEGKLAPRFNALVRLETCAEVARSVGLGDVLRLGRSEMLSGGRRKDALLGDALEAVIAAVYLDAGFEAAKAMVLRLWADRIDNVAEDARDAKSALQEWVQARGLPPPTYAETGRDGPDHAPVFTVEVVLATGQSLAARAGSKRTAEQAAAAAMLAQLESDHDSGT